MENASASSRPPTLLPAGVERMGVEVSHDLREGFGEPTW